MKATITREALRDMLVTENLFNNGTNEEYKRFLDTYTPICETVEVDDQKILNIANSIVAYSDIEEELEAYGYTEDEYIQHLTFILLNECVVYRIG